MQEFKILLTGAFGGVGRQVLDLALERGYSVSVFDLATKANMKRAAAYENRLTNLYWGDLRNFEDVSAAVAGQDAVIHLGAIITPLSENQPELSYAVNVGGTCNIIKAIEHSDRRTVFVFASSMSIMGASIDRKPPLKVTDPVMGNSHYTSQKIECEQKLRESKISWTIARLGAVINTDLSAGGGSLKDLMAEVFAMRLENRIESVWNIDAATALLNAALLLHESGEIAGKTFFIGGGIDKGWQLTVREFYTSVFDALGFGMLAEKCFSTDPYYADWLDTEESQRLLQYQNHSFEDFLKAMETKMGMKRRAIRLLAPVIRKYMESLAFKS